MQDERVIFRVTPIALAKLMVRIIWNLTLMDWIRRFLNFVLALWRFWFLFPIIIKNQMTFDDYNWGKRQNLMLAHIADTFVSLSNVYAFASSQTNLTQYYYKRIKITWMLKRLSECIAKTHQNSPKFEWCFAILQMYLRSCIWVCDIANA